MCRRCGRTLSCWRRCVCVRGKCVGLCVTRLSASSPAAASFQTVALQCPKDGRLDDTAVLLASCPNESTHDTAQESRTLRGHECTTCMRLNSAGRFQSSPEPLAHVVVFRCSPEGARRRAGQVVATVAAAAPNACVFRRGFLTLESAGAAVN